MKTITLLALVGGILTSCGGPSNATTNESQPLDAREHRIEFGGADATSLYRLLEAEGVPVTPGFGASTLELADLSCTRPVVFRPTTTCTFVFVGGGARLFRDDDAGEAFRVLAAHGGSYTDGTFGTDKTKAKDLVCWMPVVPHPQATCSFIKPESTPIDDPWLVRVEGKQAALFINAMEAAGLPARHAIDAELYSATEVFCSHPIVPNPRYSCNFKTTSGEFLLTGLHARLTFLTLDSYGAQYFDGMLGSAKVKALDLNCRQPLGLEPQPTCSFRKPK
jgi:hypothetical protein